MEQEKEMIINDILDKLVQAEISDLRTIYTFSATLTRKITLGAEANSQALGNLRCTTA